MTDFTTDRTEEMIDPVTGEIIDQKELAERLLAQAKEQGVSLVGPGGLLNQRTKNVLETVLEAELTEHLGHDHGQTPIAASMRNGTRVKTVLTEIGPVEIEVPRDRDGSLTPVIVPKGKRRLDGIDQIVLSLSARGLTTGEIAAHFEEVYGAKVSKDTISRITSEGRRRAGRVVLPSAGPALPGALRRRDRRCWSATGRCATPRSTSSWA
ncbi:transposase [Kocuria nitroreducens]|uniref:transposase n=1 Tax=Kocuria nitroreducens TaxID=3058914 RepID=UPI0036DD8CFE